ncbi:hypothetical protein J6253_01100 [bacterium]|nr:hypothetical protein [bacterium]
MNISILEKRGINPKILGSLQKEPELLEFSLRILEKADLNANSFKNFLRYTREIGLREEKPFDEIFENAGLFSILDNENLSEKTKGEELMSRLYNLRYPFWSRKQANFTKLKNRFCAATGGDIVFPDFAEGNSFKISFTIKNEADIEKIEQTIASALPLLKESLQEIKENS